MLPDFSSPDKGVCDRTSKKATQSNVGKGFTPPKSSQQFNKQNCLLPSSEAEHRSTTPSKPRSKRKKKHSKGVCQYIVETLSSFLSLWDHRYDYLYSPHPDPGTKPDWRTESRHPLSDRLLVQGSYLYGLRPGASSTYGLLDIDRGSPYHPLNNPLALSRILEALEPLGLVASLKLTSSDSQGLHVYLPIAEALPSWQLAIAIAALLENAGFKIMSGWLEVFPNRKPFSPDGSYSLFNGHRLPLQQGSYLLNDDLQPIASSHQAFVRQWHLATAQNDISLLVLEQTIAQAKRKAYRVTGKAQKFLNDLNAEIEPGWTGPGQTNHILGRITMRSYIFGHIIGAEAPLNGKALVDDIVKVARALPGFSDYCGHQQDLVKKAKAWAHAIEQKQHYFPYASGKAFKAKQGPSWNEQQAAEAREHIRQVTIELCRQNALPDDITSRFKRLCDCHISGETLYRNKDLWHPVHISEHQRELFKTGKEALHVREGAECTEGASALPESTSLLRAAGRNKPYDRTSSNSGSDKTAQKPVAGRNKPYDGTSSDSDAAKDAQQVERTAPPEQLSLNIQWALQIARSKQRAQVEANQRKYRREKKAQARAEHVAKLQRWADSDDPILQAEAVRQLNRSEELQPRK